MNKAMYNIMRDLKKERVIKNYAHKERLIEPALYRKLKAKKKCDQCGTKFSGRIPRIHHKIAHEVGGSNTEENLMAVCKRCHDKLDGEQEMIKCNNCGREMPKGENCFGIPLQGDYQCTSCFERMPESKRNKLILKGVVPITRSPMCDEWKSYCEKFGLKC
jgi:hypothetical protein